MILINKKGKRKNCTKSTHTRYVNRMNEVTLNIRVNNVLIFKIINAIFFKHESCKKLCLHRNRNE